MDLLKKNVKEGKIILTTSTIVINEVNTHIKNQIPIKYGELKRGGVLNSREYQLDNATRIGRSASKNFDAYKFRVLRSFNCPYCGNTIQVDLIS